MKSLIVGNGGRESALARAMAADSTLHAVVGHPNPSIVGAVRASGGETLVADVCDGTAIADFAAAHGVELAMVSSDEPLAAGVVDELQARGIATVGPTAAGSEIEWNKVYARELLAEVSPSALPRLRVAQDEHQARAAIDSFGETPVVVKPAGLTGGKGVKVMGPHLADHEAALDYALTLLAGGGPGSSVLVEERIDGPEFTIQAISDGRTVVLPPATYDFPYRYDGDSGPGTGGMGSLSLDSPTLPFMSERHYEEAAAIIEAVIGRLHADGRHFSGVMNSGFFATADGVKVIEFNARFGDPECMNIMALLRGSWIDAMRAILAGRLHADDVPLAREASLVLYLVSPDYALGRGGEPIEFELDVSACEREGCTVDFSSTVEVAPGRFRTVGTSRALAFSTSGPSLEDCRARLTACARRVPALEWREDIGTMSYLDSLPAPQAPGA